MAGPIDCRVAPTRVSELAVARPIDWFERNLVGIVPLRHRGAPRRGYPGLVQVAAFMNMNLERHVNAFRACYRDLASGQAERAQTTRDLYEEY
jgi:poly(3-hydroxybutyrate) depolymerase